MITRITIRKILIYIRKTTKWKFGKIHSVKFSKDRKGPQARPTELRPAFAKIAMEACSDMSSLFHPLSLLSKSRTIPSASTVVSPNVMQTKLPKRLELARSVLIKLARLVTFSGKYSSRCHACMMKSAAKIFCW